MRWPALRRWRPLRWRLRWRCRHRHRAGRFAASQAAAGPPAGFVAPADPKPDDTNFQRSRSQPGNNAPMWRAVRESGAQHGVTQAEGIEAGTLIQSFTQYPGSLYTTAGEAWRQARNHWIIPYGGALLLLVVVSIGLFYWRVGPLGGHEPDTGRVIERFTVFERTAHAANAVAFVVLAISGIVMAWGKFFLLPVIGGTLFGWLTLCAEDGAQLRRPVVRRLADRRDPDLRARQPAALRRHGVAREGGRPAEQARGAVAPLQRGREARVLVRRLCARPHRRRCRPGARQGRSGHRVHARRRCRSPTWCTASPRR